MDIINIAIMAHINKTDIAPAMSAVKFTSAEKEEGAKRFASLFVRFERRFKSITSLPIKNSNVLYYDALALSSIYAILFERKLQNSTLL